MASETIHVVNGYDKGAYTYYPVLIVGAGESGIAMACRLKEELGFDQFRVFDRQSGMGGTWWINRYPGVACDVPAIFYSFSFCPNNKWTTFHPPGPEIVKYLHGVCDKYEIVDKIQLNTEITEARWLEHEEIWEVTLTHMFPGTGDLSERERKERIAEHGRESVYIREEIVRAKIIASAAGGLVEPRGWPDKIPGRETFEGDVFHSARWNYDVDLNGKDVIVVGTGCSAAQFVPRLTKEPFNAKSVTQIMRSPPWVVPRPQPPFGKETWEKWSPVLLDKIPGLSRAFRTLIFAVAELDYFKIFHNTPYCQKSRAKMEADLIRHMKKSVPEKYHEILTPDYGVGCKRRILDATWFPGLNDPNVDLTTQPLTSVQAKSVTLGPGRTYPDPQNTSSNAPTDQVTLPADTIILANGFDVTTWLHPLRIRGKGGKYMHDVWTERGGPQAYMGAAMDGFPNLFIIFGPNTATGHSSVILASENMANYSLKFMKPLLKGDVKTVEVKKEAEVAWTNEMQQSLKDTVWMSGGCTSWYYTANGWNATAYPYSQIDYTIKCMFPKWADWHIQYTSKGLRKHRLRQALKYAAFVAAIVGLYRARKQGLALRAMPDMVRMLMRLGALRLLNGLQAFFAKAASKV